MQQVVDLAFDRTNFNFRIDEAGGTDDLFDNDSGGFCELVRAGSRRYVHELVGAMLEFLKGQRTVIERRGHAEAVFDQHFFARAIAGVHAAQLRDGLVRFVDEHQEVAGKIIEQGGRRLARAGVR